MATLDLSLFGGFAAHAQGETLVFPTRKAQALLAYLALGEGRAFERAQLCALLWGESQQRQAFSSLRQTLFNIRKVLPSALKPALISSARSVALDISRVTTDAAQLTRALSAATREGLREVATLYRGSLLDGLSIDESGFDEWLRIEQSRYHERASTALVQLAQREDQAGELAAAIEVRLQLCRLSPWDEHNHRSLMQLYARDGRRSTALAHFRMCKEILQRELGVDPEAATLKLCQEIADGEYAASASEREELAQAPVSRPISSSCAGPRASQSSSRASTARPLVCREREVALLSARFRRAAEGEAGVATLIGEAGAGKTSILDELAREVRAVNGHVLVGRCYESEQVLPFAPWVSALRLHPALHEEALWAELPPSSRAVLMRIFARAETLPDQLAPQDDVLHVFEGYLALLERLSRSAPLLLALDDMHWADDMSLRLFSFLGRRLVQGRRAPVLLLATLRKEELSRRALLHTSLGELAHDERALSIAVEPLSQEDTALLLRSALASEASTRASGPDEALASVDALVWKLSEGNPLVIVEAARALAVGALAVDAADLPIPERVREVIAGHIARLSPFEQQLTSLAAVVGREFELPLLCEMAEHDVVATGSAVEALVRAGVFKESGDKLYFSHTRIREVIYAGLLPQRRAVLHAHVARSLLSVYAAALPEVHGSLAFHFTRAGDRRSAVTYLAAFADHAAASFGIDEALSALARASDLARELASDERSVCLIELHLRRAKCLFHLGRFAEIAPCLAPHLPLLDALARPDLKAQVHFWIGCASGLLGDTSAAASDGARALEEAMRCGGVKAARRAHTLIAWEAAFRGHFERGIEHGLAATVSLTSADREVEYQAAGFMIAGINYLYCGRQREAREALSSAIALARESGVARVQSLSLAYLALLHAELADERAALVQCAEAVALAPDPVTSAGTLSLLLHVHVRTGRADEAKLTFAKLVATVTPLAQRTPQGGVLIALAEALLLSAQPLEAARVAQEALTSARGAGHRLIEGASLRLLGQCALAQEEHAEAARRLGESRAILTELGAAFQLGRTLCALAALAQHTGDLERSALWREQAEELYRALQLPVLVARVDDVVRGMACLRTNARTPMEPGVVVHAALSSVPVAASPAASSVATMRTS